MRKFLLLSVWLLLAFAVTAQQTPVTKANYALAARFSPKKLSKMIFSTAVDPHWLKNSDKFWYMYETTEGKKWYIVDPVKGEKKELFNNADLAAKITRIVKDPFDAQNLGLDSMRFVRDENWIQFEVKSTQDEVKKDTAAVGRRNAAGANATSAKKVFYFEYNLQTGELIELSDFKKPKRRPNWASISPDGNVVVFGKNYNIYWMDKANYEKALKNENDSTIVEYALTQDGIDGYGYYNDGNLSGSGMTDDEKEKEMKRRRPVFALWSPDSKYFAVTNSA